MSDFIENVLDPFEIFFDRDKDKDDDKEEDKKEEAAPGISDAEAQRLAKKRLFRSGTVFTNTLGEDVTDAQTEGTRLI